MVSISTFFIQRRDLHFSGLVLGSVLTDSDIRTHDRLAYQVLPISWGSRWLYSSLASQPWMWPSSSVDRRYFPWMIFLSRGHFWSSNMSPRDTWMACLAWEAWWLKYCLDIICIATKQVKSSNSPDQWYGDDHNSCDCQCNLFIFAPDEPKNLEQSFDQVY